MTSGIYIHVPFCKSRCSYCDFATGLYDRDLAARYVAALLKDIRNTRHVDLKREVDTVYFGGGTPSMLSAEQIAEILNAVHECFEVAANAEVTMEINPGSVDSKGLRQFRQVGINRASFGAQTFDDRELARLGRAHSSSDTRGTFESLREVGFDNVSFDLIAGLPGQSLDQWKINVETSLSLRPEHLSFYLLEVHAGTPLAQHIERGLQPRPDEDLAAEMYEWMLERASVAGYEHYEISNLCLPGFESRHNLKYWQGVPYYGFGCSAHSYDGSNHRWSNERDVLAYVRALENNESPVTTSQVLSRDEVRAEAVYLGMRVMRGLDTSAYRQLFGVDLVQEHIEDWSRFEEAGLIEFDGDVVRLTRAGALMSNEVFSRFV